MRTSLRSFFGSLALIVGLFALAAPLPARAGGRVFVNSDMCTAWGGGNNFCFHLTDVPAGLSNVVAVATGSPEIFALRSDGSVVVWGSASPTSYSPPTSPTGLSNVVAIAASEQFPGGDTAMALQRDGRLAFWGSSASLWLAQTPPGLNDVASIAAGNGVCMAVRSNGTVLAWSDPFNSPHVMVTTMPSSLANVASVSIGMFHALALRANGTVAAWGDNYYGQTDVPTGLSNVVAVAAGYRHSLALRADGTVVAWGNSVGANVPPGLSNVVQIAAGMDRAGDGYSVAVLANRRMVGWGSSWFAQDLSNNSTDWGQLSWSNILSVVAGPWCIAAVCSAEPVIRAQPVSRSVVAGDTVSFSVTANSPTPMTYQWRFNGTNIADATNATLVISNVQAADTGPYDVVAINDYGSVTSTVAVLSFRVVNVEMLAAVTVQGAAGANARVDWSTDLKTWNTLTNFALPYSPFRFADWDSIGKPQRFYRVVFP